MEVLCDLLRRFGPDRTMLVWVGGNEFGFATARDALEEAATEFPGSFHFFDLYRHRVLRQHEERTILDARARRDVVAVLDPFFVALSAFWQSQVVLRLEMKDESIAYPVADGQRLPSIKLR